MHGAWEKGPQSGRSGPPAAKGGQAADSGAAPAPGGIAARAQLFRRGPLAACLASTLDATRYFLPSLLW